MAAHLVIHDGSPWWASPDIWVVPGADPNGPPGSPIAGIANYLWARVANTGNVAVSGCRVDFYWANPSAAMVVGIATFVGSAFADLAPGDEQEVLCLVPWTPVIVNGGHECLLAVVHGTGDSSPIPDPLPSGYAFDPPAHDQIAQLNVSVLQAAMLRIPLVLFVTATGRRAKRARLEVKIGGEVDARVLRNLGLQGLEPARDRHVEVTLGRDATCQDHAARPEITVEVPRASSLPVFVHFATRKLRHDQYQLVHVVEHADDRVVGGVSYLVVNSHVEQERAS